MERHEAPRRTNRIRGTKGGGDTASSDTGTRRKVCLVTGATAGMGEATARALAATGATVVVVGRDIHKGSAAVERMRRETGNAAVELMLADLSSQAKIRRLAGDFQDRYGRLDVLVNNVGALFLRRLVSADGIEMTFALNHLAPFLLTNLLLDALRASGLARIVNVSSYGHGRGRLELSDLQFERRPYSGMAAYRQSKLANVLFTYELARRLGSGPITVNALDPGNVATHFGLNNFGFLRGRALRAAEAAYFLAVRQTAAEGARTAIYLATSPDVEGVSGGYFEKRARSESSAASHDGDAARRLWDASAALTGAGPAP